MKVGTQVVGPAVIGRDAGRGAGGEGVGNEAGRGPATSRAQAKRLAVALEAGDGQREPRAGGRAGRGRLLPQQASVSPAEGAPCLHQFVRWSDLDPRAQARGPRWLGRRAQKVLRPYPIGLSESAGGLAGETGEGAVWLEAIVQDFIGICESGGWAGDLMCIRFLWKEKGGGRGLFKPLKQNSRAEQSQVGFCLLVDWFVCLFVFSNPHHTKSQAGASFPRQRKGRPLHPRFLEERDQSRKIVAQVHRAQLIQAMRDALGPWPPNLWFCGTLGRDSFHFTTQLTPYLLETETKASRNDTYPATYNTLFSSLLSGAIWLKCWS